MEMGAGIVECDVAVTKDGELVCRHAQVPFPSPLSFQLLLLARVAFLVFMPGAHPLG
jgi:glycerophosphoryl diester phosphodiesterase